MSSSNRDISEKSLEQELLKTFSDRICQQKTKSFMSDLLPYEITRETRVDLRTGLKEYQMLLTACLEALYTFKEGDLEKFDALVGENACEIRAVWIAMIATNKETHLDPLIDKILITKDQIKKTLEPKTINRLMIKKPILHSLFTIENLLIPISYEQKFILESFLLTEAKTKNSRTKILYAFQRDEKSDPKQLKKFGNISSTFANNLLNKARKSVAISSVLFTRECALKNECKSTIRMVSSEFTYIHHGRLFCIPMFWTYKSLISIAIKEEIPLAIHTQFLKKTPVEYRIVGEAWLLFEADGFGYRESEKDLSEFDPKKPIWVIQGITYSDSSDQDLWRKRVLAQSIEKVILAGAADHRQFPDPNLDAVIRQLEDKEYETFRSVANLEGFSLNNPSTFLIQHVYPSSLKALKSFY